MLSSQATVGASSARWTVASTATPSERSSRRSRPRGRGPPPGRRRTPSAHRCRAGTRPGRTPARGAGGGSWMSIARDMGRQRNQSLDLPLHVHAKFSSVCFNRRCGRLGPAPRRRRAHQAAPAGRDAGAARRARRGRGDAARHHDRRGRQRGQRQLPLRLARGALLRDRQAGHHAPARRAARTPAGARRRRHGRADRGRDRRARSSSRCPLRAIPTARCCGSSTGR